MLLDCIRQHQMRLEEQQSNLLVTRCGHGDCKPSNLLLYSQDNGDNDNAPLGVRFLDLELAGTHFVAFDLAKLWRSSGRPTSQSREMKHIFLESYAAACDEANVNVDLLQQQMDELMPLTWLEAAAFFVAMSSSSSKSISEREHWCALALDRLRSYEDSLSTCS